MERCGSEVSGGIADRRFVAVGCRQSGLIGRLVSSFPPDRQPWRFVLWTPVPSGTALTLQVPPAHPRAPAENPHEPPNLCNRRHTPLAAPGAAGASVVVLPITRVRAEGGVRVPETPVLAGRYHVRPLPAVCYPGWRILLRLARRRFALMRLWGGGRSCLVRERSRLQSFLLV